MNKLLKNVYIDQYGQIFYADTVKELKDKIGRTKAHKCTTIFRERPTMSDML